MQRTSSVRVFAFPLVVLFAVVLMFVLVACKPATGQSLRAIHTEGQLDKMPVVDGNLCLNCHTTLTIAKATEAYGGQAGLNIHEPPASMKANYGDCISCHKMDDLPTLTCNTFCHDFKLPEGWSAP